MSTTIARGRPARDSAGRRTAGASDGRTPGVPQRGPDGRTPDGPPSEPDSLMPVVPPS
ncbi:hypothetical protein ACIPJQ_07440 [Streptomyces griseoviridis]